MLGSGEVERRARLTGGGELGCNGCAMLRIVTTAVLLIALATSARAEFDEGVAAYERGDYATALREWRPLAEQGNANAQYLLGLMYFDGLALEMNPYLWDRRNWTLGEVDGRTVRCNFDKLDELAHDS